jgi:predicted short-subunit dehydrogenase-like oxidoreductase (DUF2520 family)
MASVMLPDVRAKPRVTIVGAGNLANALAVSLHTAGYEIEEIIARSRGASFRKAQKLAKAMGTRASVISDAALESPIVWFCVPDAEIKAAAKILFRKFDSRRIHASTGNWRNKITFHSSGALTSDELDRLRQRGAAVASVHPMMTFVPRMFSENSELSLNGVPFAVEGDGAAVRVARRIVSDFGGRAYSIRKADKAAYHAWGMFASPLLDVLLATTERVARLAGVGAKDARQRMIPILQHTLANYASFGTAGAFSGPIIRGDADTIKRHLRVLRREPAARDVYLALARAALRYLPSKKTAELKKALGS